MNALELADWIENGAPFGKYETAKQAVVMLRQQQAEIEALKQIIDANNLSQNIGQFVKPTNEPVAWMRLTANKDTRISLEKFHNDDIVLYTHSVKEHFEGEPQAEELHEILQSNAELTDEEINVVAILQDAEIVPVGHEIWKTDEEFNKYKRIVLATAKALRKAQEK